MPARASGKSKGTASRTTQKTARTGRAHTVNEQAVVGLSNRKVEKLLNSTGYWQPTFKKR